MCPSCNTAALTPTHASRIIFIHSTVCLSDCLMVHVYPRTHYAALPGLNPATMYTILTPPQYAFASFFTQNNSIKTQLLFVALHVYLAWNRSIDGNSSREWLGQRRAVTHNYRNYYCCPDWCLLCCDAVYYCRRPTARRSTVWILTESQYYP
jgi:hypothetical protein